MLNFIFSFMRSRRTAVYFAVYGMAALSLLGTLVGRPFWMNFAWLWSFSIALGCIAAGLGYFARAFLSLLTGDFRGLCFSLRGFITCVIVYYIFVWIVLKSGFGPRPL